MIEIPMIMLLNVFFTLATLFSLFVFWAQLLITFWKIFDSESSHPSIKSITLSTVIAMLPVLFYCLIYFKIVVFV